MLKKLLVRDPHLRLGAGDYLNECNVEVRNDLEQLMEHPFFLGIDFKTLHTERSPLADSFPTSSPSKEMIAQMLPGRKRFMKKLDFEEKKE